MASKVAVAEAKLSRMHHRQDAFLRRHRDIHGQVRPDIWRSGIEHVRGMKIAAALATARPKGKRLRLTQPPLQLSILRFILRLGRRF